MRHVGDNTRTLQWACNPPAQASRSSLTSPSVRIRGVLGVCVCLKVALDLRFDLSKFSDSMTTLTTRSLPRFASILVT
jgi:hypothetical protein